MKKLLSLLLTISIILSLVTAIPVQAASNFYGEWKQYSGYWKGYKLGSSSCTVKSAGCTTTALAMAAVKLGCESESSFDPGIFVTRMNNVGGYNSLGGIYWEKINKAVPNMSMVGSEIKFSTESNSTRIAKIGENLNKGYAVLITILRYTEQNGKKHWHYVLADSVNGGVLNILDPGGANGNITNNYGSSEIMIYSIRMFKNNGQTKYKENVVVPPETHICSYSVSTDSNHPHNKYNVCSCGKKVYIGKNIVTSCSLCHPVGNVNLTRSFEKTKGTATFYRNNVYNANSYTLKLYKNNSLYNIYTMNNLTYTVRGLPSGNYYAVLYAKNTNTNEEHSIRCENFKITDTYTVSYNANGGKNAPTSQTKIEDTSLTLTSSVPIREGYKFKGWSASRNSLEAQYRVGDSYTKNAKITLYAVWEPEIYTVSFDTNGGVGIVENQTITYGNMMKMPNTIVKDYSYLIGWSTDKNATKPEYSLGVDYKIKENLKLYAVWGNATWSNEVSKSLKGSGTETDPYLISTAADLAYLANKVNTQTCMPTYEYYKMTDNINLAYNEWVPIGIYGNENQYFCGSFDGNGYTISDLYITQANQNYVGLFGYVKDSNIKNLTVTGAVESIEADNKLNIGGIVGYATGTKLTNLFAKYFNIGGISVNTGTSSVGTIIGKSEKGTIDSCKSEDCSINLKSGIYNAGMIVGHCMSDINDCSVFSADEGLFSAANSVKNSNIGGICGLIANTAERCAVDAPYFSNNIKTTSSYIGGFVGRLDGEVKVCSVKFTDGEKNSMTVESSSSVYLGGFSGYSGSDAKITDCKLDGKTVSASTSSGTAYAGGLIGYAIAKENQTVSVNGGQSLSYVILPKKEGYKATWYTDSAYTKPYDFTQKITQNLTLYAKWEKGDDTPDIWDGTSKEPAYNAETKTYTITNGEELAWVSDVTNSVITSGTNFPTDITFNGYTIELANDIYLNDVSNVDNWKTVPPQNNWKQIGRKNQFSGTFNGNNFSIYGCYVNAENQDIGLIAELCGNSEIKNITLSCNYMLWSGDDYHYYNTPYIGGIIGRISGNSGCIKISNCHNNGTVIGVNAGGIVGQCYGPNLIITDCSNSGSVSTSSTAGGIVGVIDNYPYSCEIKNCYNNGKITSSQRTQLGGIVGRIEVPGTQIENCYNTGYIYSYRGGGQGGICGRDAGWGNQYKYCYNIGNITGPSDSEVGGIIGCGAGVSLYCCYSTDSNAHYGLGYFELGFDDGKTRSKLEYSYACNSNLYGYFNNVSDYKPNLYSVKYVSLSNLKNLSNLTGFSSSVWGTNSNINNGYPYLKSMEETYKTYTVTAITDEDNAAVNRTFVNIDGDILGNYVGSIIGYGNGGTVASSVVKNIVGMADNVSAVDSADSSVAYSGGLIGYNNKNKFTFENAYYNSEMNVTSSTGNVDTTGIARSKKTMNTTFYTNILGLTPYSSLQNLGNDEKAVWVLKNGELPELYYNCLNDISVSKNIENGTITIDKTQAIDGESVTITAVPNENYVLNKIYVNGKEIPETSFTVSGDSEVFATFNEKVAEYNVSVTADENATATIANVDATVPMLMSIEDNSSPTTTMIAKDGEEIMVTTNAADDYTVDAVYVNGEEVAGNSFVLTDNSNITMKVTNISTEINATTNDTKDVGSYFAIVSGSIENADEDTVKYIRYWSADDTETIYTTTVETGSGAYTTEITDLKPSTMYYYQMTEQGEIKTFTTDEEIIPVLNEDEIEENDNDSKVDNKPIMSTTYKKLASSYELYITSSKALNSEALYVAAYNTDGRLLCLHKIKCNGGTSYSSSFPIDSEIDYVKIFVWESDITMTPVAEVEILDIIN